MKVDLKATTRDYGFGLTVVVSAVNGQDGTPLGGLTDKNFSILAVQTPNGWATSDVMKIKSGLNEPTAGIYIFSIGPSGNKKLSDGPYVLAITMAGSKERGVPYNGQTIVSARVGN
jgi:hypothetical protein